MLNVEREAFLGGETFSCRNCGTVVVENYYPTTEVSTSARRIWNEDQDKAKSLGIHFEKFPESCICESEK